MKKIRVHPERIVCPYCSKPDHPFKAVHYPGPPCVKCGAKTTTTATAHRKLWWYCVECQHLEEQG